MLAHTAAPLYDLLKKNVRWSWGRQQTRAFKETKDLMCSAQCLAHFDGVSPVVVAADASPVGVGAVLSVITEQGERPVRFASRSLSAAERNYSQLEREALAVVFAVTKFHQYVFGRSFTVTTDHLPLLALLANKKPLTEAVSPRVCRWRLTLSAYSF